MMRDYHIHQYLAHSPLPQIDDEYRASARQSPGEWMHLVDPSLPKGAPTVFANVLGGWEVGPDGEFTGRYWVNPEIMPQPATAGIGFHAPFELVVWRLVNGYVTLGEFVAGFAEAELLVTGKPETPLELEPRSPSDDSPILGVYTSRHYCQDGQEHWRRVTGRDVIDTLGERDDVLVVINPGGALGVDFTGAELAALWHEQQAYLAEVAADPSAEKPRVLGEPTTPAPPEETASPREVWWRNADPEARKAVEKVEAWLRSPDGPDDADKLRVDYDNVRRTPEGWTVYYDTRRWLDEGDGSGQLFPPPAITVRVPQGDLRRPSPLSDGVSHVVENRNGDTWLERVDPEFTNSGLGGLGVPDKAVVGWVRMRPDRSYGETRWNPDADPGPVRRGFPPADNTLEQLLNFHFLGWLTREKFLIGLVISEIVIPLHWDSENVASGWTENPRRLWVYSSSRRLVPVGLSRWHKWWTMSVHDFVEEFPDTGLVINRSQSPPWKSTPTSWPALSRSGRGASTAPSEW